MEPSNHGTQLAAWNAMGMSLEDEQLEAAARQGHSNALREPVPHQLGASSTDHTVGTARIRRRRARDDRSLFDQLRGGRTRRHLKGSVRL
jgi:hypothetical protein